MKLLAFRQALELCYHLENFESVLLYQAIREAWLMAYNDPKDLLIPFPGTIQGDTGSGRQRGRVRATSYRPVYR
jgi:hypothetical protein